MQFVPRPVVEVEFGACPKSGPILKSIFCFYIFDFLYISISGPVYIWNRHPKSSCLSSTFIWKSVEIFLRYFNIKDEMWIYLYIPMVKTRWSIKNERIGGSNCSFSIKLVNHLQKGELSKYWLTLLEQLHKINQIDMRAFGFVRGFEFVRQLVG